MKISNISKRTLKERSIKKLYFGINHSCRLATSLIYRDENLDRDGINLTGPGKISAFFADETIYDYVSIFNISGPQPSLSKICNDYCGRKY